MEVKLLNIGFGSTVLANRVVAIVSPASAPMKRLKEDAKLGNKLIDATMGRRTRSIIVITTNVGAEEMSETLRHRTVGFEVKSDHDQLNKDVAHKAVEAAKDVFPYEFLNRFDEIVVFQGLSRPDVQKILEIMLTEVQVRLLENDIILDVRKKAKELLIERGYDPRYGARPLRRVIQKQLEDPLSMEVLKGKIRPGSRVTVGVRKDALSFNAKNQPSNEPTPAGVAG